MFAAFDPGRNTGVALFNADGSDYSKASFRDDHLYVALTMLKTTHKTHKFDRFIVEDYKLRQNKALDLIGIEGYADRAIGAIKFVAWELGVKVDFQSPALLSTAMKWAGVKHNGHLPDQLSAYCHGVYWLVNNGIRRNRILDEE